MRELMNSLLRLLGARDGSTLPMMALSIGGIMTLVGMSLAIGMDTRTAGQLQGSADNAALAGATAFLTSAPSGVDQMLNNAYDTAYNYAAANVEFVPKSVEVEAVTTDSYGQSTRIFVELEFHPANVFNRFGGSSADEAVRRSATAIATRHFPLCILTLAETGPGIELLNSAETLAPDCAMWSNSSASEPIRLNGGAKLEASSICVAGTPKRVQGTISPQPEGNCHTIPDPLAGWKPPVFGACDFRDTRIKRNGTLPAEMSPGVYCGGLDIQARNVELAPGLYVIKDGELEIDATDSINGVGVMFLLSGDNASAEISANKEINLMAQATGDFAGILLAEDRTTRAVNSSTGAATGAELVSEFSGSGEFVLEGAIYLPTQRLIMKGSGSGIKSSPYLQMVGKRYSMGNNRRLLIRFDEAEMSVPVVIEPVRSARLTR